ncbi:MAG: FAD binding domain-containing protein [Thermodesulfobacteriota bacterium]
MFDIGYTRPESLDEALDFLVEKGKETALLAGGTDIVVDLKSGDLQKKHLLDVSRLKELKGIEMTDEGLSVGAAVTLSEICSSETLARYAPALKKCAYTFAGKQIRNVATIGGNVAHCSPCGDTVPPLVIHEAEAVLANKNGQRKAPVEQIASGPYTCSLPTEEIIVRFILKPAHDMDFADFRKIGRRKELAISRISMAAMLRRDPDGRVAFMRFSLGSCTPIIQRFEEVEAHFMGKTPTEPLLWEAGKMLTDHMFAITGRRSSAVYKEPAIQGLFVRMLHPLV